MRLTSQHHAVIVTHAWLLEVEDVSKHAAIQWCQVTPLCGQDAGSLTWLAQHKDSAAPHVWDHWWKACADVKVLFQAC